MAAITRALGRTASLACGWMWFEPAAAVCVYMHRGLRDQEQGGDIDGDDDDG